MIFSGNLEQEIAVSETSNIVDFLEAGLRAENLRQAAIANNVANLQTPGYRRLDINFAQRLAEALNSSDEVDFDEVGLSLFHPMDTPVQSNGNDVNLESEVGEMVKNSLLHTTYIRLLNKQYQQMQAAIDVK